jgi:hypothetical protein
VHRRKDLEKGKDEKQADAISQDLEHTAAISHFGRNDMELKVQK